MKGLPHRAIPTWAEIDALMERRKARRAARKAKGEALGLRKPKAKKPRKVTRKVRMKRLKKDGHALWSLVVRKRDGNKCLMCGVTENLNAHHWLFRKSHSVWLALEPANGATLCAYPCHLGRIHHDGDGDFMLRLADKMIQIVGQSKVDEMRETARIGGPVSLEEIEAAHQSLKSKLEGQN